MRIDAHQHFWHYSPAEHIWMNNRMEVLKHDFLPHDLQPLLKPLEFDGSVAVQARQSLEETQWLLQLAERHDFIKAVVGWVDLCSSELSKQLIEFAGHSKLCGVRHVLHDEPDDEFMLRPGFRGGISKLEDFNLTYDLLLFPRHIPHATRLVREFPRQAFVLDHIGKPMIAEGRTEPWREDVLRLAESPNVHCKLSGMVTEANWKQWKAEDFQTYLDIVVEAFGPDRLMIGSDWPVCILSADYEATMQIVVDYIARFAPIEQAGIFGENCARFYGIAEGA
jgi:L-fuconolactonase